MNKKYPVSTSSRSLWVLCLSLSLLLSGCASYRVCTPHVMAKHGQPTTSPETRTRKEMASEHWWYRIVPRHRCQIRWYDLGHWLTWAILGNDDDGAFGEEPSANFQPDEEANGRKALQWALRNPLHNFCFYCIGTAYTPTSELTLLQLARNNSAVLQYDPCAKTVFAGESTSLFIGLHSWLPFISLRLDYGRRLEFYAGWRERGNFGFKFIPARKIPCQECTEESDLPPRKEASCTCQVRANRDDRDSPIVDLLQGKIRSSYFPSQPRGSKTS